MDQYFTRYSAPATTIRQLAGHAGKDIRNIIGNTAVVNCHVRRIDYALELARKFMTDIDLNFISRQLEHVLADQQLMRNQLIGIRDELTLQREQLRIQGSAIIDILDRLRILETR